MYCGLFVTVAFGTPLALALISTVQFELCVVTVKVVPDGCQPLGVGSHGLQLVGPTGMDAGVPGATSEPCDNVALAVNVNVPRAATEGGLGAPSAIVYCAS